MLYSDIKRSGRSGDRCFITCVTKNREPLFANRSNIILFMQTLREVQAIKKADIIAYVIMPDHIHMIIQSTASTTLQIMKSLKWNFTQNWKLISPLDNNLLNPAHLWQEKFWEHAINDDRDLHNHINYIIKNPVKHGYVDDPEDWPYSSFAQNVMNNDIGFGEMITT
jgi:putative transposase